MVIVLSFLNIGIAATPVLILVCGLLIPTEYFVARHAAAASYENIIRITKRVHLVSEILTVIKFIKFYAWEGFFEHKITSKRKAEIEGTRKVLNLRIWSIMIVFMTPNLLALLSFGVYALVLDQPLTANIIFSMLALFNTLRYPLVLLPAAVRECSAANKSYEKLEAFLLQPEVDDPKRCMGPVDDPNVCIEIVSFALFIA